jgi:hypothetical protein
VAETSPGVEVEQAHDPMKEYLDHQELLARDSVDCPVCGGIDSLEARWSKEFANGFWIINCEKCNATCTCSIEQLPPSLWGDDDNDDAVFEKSPSVEVEPIKYYRFGVEAVLVPEVPASGPEEAPDPQAYDGCVYCTSPEYSGWRDETYRCCRCNPDEAETSSTVDREDAPKCSDCFDDGFFEDEWGLIKSCHCSVHNPILSCQKSQCAIAPAASDLNPILTGIALSDRFLALYSPPQAEIIQFQSDADGQLSLLDFKVQSAEEPPDPDDFGSIEEFHKELAHWDAENAEMIAVSMDSMCEWAPCPYEWYEPEVENLPLKASSMIELSEQSEVMELSTGSSGSVSCDFSIPVFCAWCDRDEPPDTGIFARLPKPKPPKFPPQSASWTQVEHKLNTSWTRVKETSRNYPETIPKLFHRVAAGSTTQPARSPPGGDA